MTKTNGKLQWQANLVNELIRISTQNVKGILKIDMAIIVKLHVSVLCKGYHAFESVGLGLNPNLTVSQCSALPVCRSTFCDMSKWVPLGRYMITWMMNWFCVSGQWALTYHRLQDQCCGDEHYKPWTAISICTQVYQYLQFT